MIGTKPSGIFALLSKERGHLEKLPPNPELVARWQKLWHERYASTWVVNPWMGGLFPVKGQVKP